MRNSFKSLVERKLEPVGRSGNDIIYRCPKCDDKSGHLYINYEKNKFHCFKCDYGGKTIVPLITELGINIGYDYASLESTYSEGLDEVLSMSKKERSKRIVDYSRNLKTLTAYYNAHVMPLSPIARYYLNNRGIPDNVIERLKIREGINRYNDSIIIDNKPYPGRDYSGRIMVPSLRQSDDLISFYVGRDYTGTKKNKYVNPNQDLAYSSEDVWNLANVDSEHIIICEGVFTAISAGGLKMNVCATYGKSISARSNSDNPHIIVTSQGEKLLARKFKTYYIAYDADAYGNSLKTAKYLHDRGANVKIVYIDPNIYGEKADVNDIGYGKFLELLAEAKEYNHFLEIEGL